VRRGSSVTGPILQGNPLKRVPERKNCFVYLTESAWSFLQCSECTYPSSWAWFERHVTHNYSIFYQVQVKGFPLQAWSGSWSSRRLRLLDLLDFRHCEGGKVVTLTPRPSLPPGVFLVLIFRGWVDPRAHGSVGSLGKNSPATPLGIDPETLQIVAQYLNHYANPGPFSIK
jgi:hypothetical protein